MVNDLGVSEDSDDSSTSTICVPSIKGHGVYKTYKTYEPSTKATFQPPASLSFSSSPNSLTIRCSKLSIS
jgi:hypothetical protein